MLKCHNSIFSDFKGKMYEVLANKKSQYNTFSVTLGDFITHLNRVGAHTPFSEGFQLKPLQLPCIHHCMFIRTILVCIRSILVNLYHCI